VLDDLLREFKKLSFLVSLPQVRVKEWLSHGDGAFLQLRPTFSAFRVDAAQLADLDTDTAKLYVEARAPGGGPARAEKLTESSYEAFVARCVNGDRPAVFVYEPVAAANLPPQDGGGRPAGARLLRGAKAGGLPPQSVGGRSSQQQDEFRASLLRRDGTMCVLCGPGRAFELRNVEAAHIVPQGSPSDVLDRYGLTSLWDTCNGVMLCGLCHEVFDQHLWYVDGDGKAVVSGVLLENDDGGVRKYWGERAGKALTAAPAHWPAAATWAYRRDKYLGAAAAVAKSVPAPVPAAAGASKAIAPLVPPLSAAAQA
jgi:hypothetical protein